MTTPANEWREKVLRMRGYNIPEGASYIVLEEDNEMWDSEDLADFIQNLLTTHTAHLIERIPLRAIERLLPQSSETMLMSAVYIPPEEQLRRQADRIVQDREDARIIREWLQAIDIVKKEI